MCREIVDNVLSGTKSGFKATRNLVFNQKAERSTMNRQKSRGLVENVLSGMEAGFKSILNIFKHQKRESRMFNQKSSSTLSTTLLALILGASVFMAGQVWAAKMVKDPSTGKMVSAPEYGGRITFVKSFIPESIDPYFSYAAGHTISGVHEKLGKVDWGLDRDLFDYRTIYVPEFAIRGHLAESWEQPDPLTVIVHIRPGVKWHDKAPMNGRELTADDIKYNFERILGLGDFTEAGPGAGLNLQTYNVESVEATDKYTVVFKLKSLILNALKNILTYHYTYILAPEVVEQYGDVRDWRNVVGTGPFELTDYVEGSSITFTKNPNYWGYDEKYPENRLPYVDELRALILKEKATILALIRSGKADYTGYAGDSQLISVDQALSLQRTNPELNLWTYSTRGETAITFNVQKPPFNDIRVRHAIQMAIDLETINNTYYKGYADWIPTGRAGTALKGYITPFEEWPEEIKQYYRYDPEGAEALLDEAGYPRGADGVRFKTVYEHYEFFDFNYYQIAMEYIRAIGIGVEVQVLDRAAHGAMKRERRHKGMISDGHGFDYPPLPAIVSAHTDTSWNNANVSDPVFDAMYEAAEAATTIEEQMRLVKEADEL